MTSAVLAVDGPRHEHPLRGMFEPRSIALVGASEKPGWSQLVMRNIPVLGFPGKLYAVNPKGVDAYGIPGYTSCTTIGEPVDLAFLLVPQAAVFAALEDAAKAGIRNAVILAAGFGEVGGDGLAAQEALVRRAAELGIRIWGPNSLGFHNISARAPLSAINLQQPILSPSIAIVSQSGASAAELNDFAHSQNIGASFIAATGNQVDVTLSDVVDYLVDHEPTKAIAIFAENISDPENFAAAAAKARAKKKPVVILKIGRSVLAGAVAQAHTGSLIGDDKVFDAVCERMGVVRVYSTEQLINVAGLLATTGPLSEGGLAYVSVSGGACTLVADAAQDYGVEILENGPDISARLREELPDFASTLNPLDVTGAVIGQPDLFERVLPILASAPGIGLIGINCTIPTGPDQYFPETLEAIGRATAKIATPSIMSMTCVKSFNDLAREAVEKHRLPHTMSGVEPTLQAVAKAFWWSKQLDEPRAPLLLRRASVDAPALASERVVLDYLAEVGVPVIPGRIATSRAEAEAFAASLEGPLAMKIASPDIAHKTEVGGVKLNVAGEEAGAVFDAILDAVHQARPDAKIDGVIISPMRSGGGIELLVGVTCDVSWGPTITVGFGGVMVEVLADVSIAALPVSHAEARGMLGRLRGAKLLQGFRGAPPADMDAVAAVIVRIGDAALKLGPALASLEVNPLLVRGAHVEALDGLVIWNDEEKPHGGH